MIRNNMEGICKLSKEQTRFTMYKVMFNLTAPGQQEVSYHQKATRQQTFRPYRLSTFSWELAHLVCEAGILTPVVRT